MLEWVGCKPVPRDENFLREGGARLGLLSSVCLSVLCPGSPEKRWSEKCQKRHVLHCSGAFRSHVFPQRQKLTVAGDLSVATLKVQN